MDGCMIVSLCWHAILCISNRVENVKGLSNMTIQSRVYKYLADGTVGSEYEAITLTVLDYDNSNVTYTNVLIDWERSIECRRWRQLTAGSY